MFVVESSFEDLHASVQTAIQNDLPLLEVKNGDGKMRSINPRQISYIEETDEHSLTPGEEQILDSVQARRQVQSQ